MRERGMGREEEGGLSSLQCLNDKIGANLGNGSIPVPVGAGVRRRRRRIFGVTNVIFGRMRFEIMGEADEP